MDKLTLPNRPLDYMLGWGGLRSKDDPETEGDRARERDRERERFREREREGGREGGRERT